MGLRVYNTLTREKEPFEPVVPGRVSMYVCGPTVYGRAHVGHAMSALVFDVIRRYLEHRGFEVRHVMNYTDVDDKIIARANEEGIDPIELAERYIREFNDHLVALNVLPASVYPRATREIDFIIEMVSGLVAQGSAYAVDGDVYFRVTRDEDYGRLSGRRLEDMAAGARVEVDVRKEHPMDFAVWKASKPGEPAWESPWGMGRPGWHIECSAMSLHHLGEQIDIHGGGADLIFPHHENEIAQTESLTGKSFARYWVHNGLLQFGGEKMSKSIGNLVTVEDFLVEHEGDALRMMILNSSYRSPLVYTEEVVEQAERALARLRAALRPPHPEAKGASDEARQALAEAAENVADGFHRSMDDDFNTAAALGHLFDLVRAVNQARDSGATDETLGPAQETLETLAGLLGLTLTPAGKAGGEAEPFVELLLEVRTELRRQKLWSLADTIRDRLEEIGVQVEDSKEGSTWRWK